MIQQNRPFPICLLPLYQNESILMKMSSAHRFIFMHTLSKSLSYEWFRSWTHFDIDMGTIPCHEQRSRANNLNCFEQCKSSRSKLNLNAPHRHFEHTKRWLPFFYSLSMVGSNLAYNKKFLAVALGAGRCIFRI